MPRLSHQLLRQANRLNSNLPNLLRATRNLPDAKLELKWIQTHIETIFPNTDHSGNLYNLEYLSKAAHLRSLCKSRSKGVPLQYLLGTEFFGPLELACRPGVLIPRAATADAVGKLLEMIRWGWNHDVNEMNVVDLCSGSGCIGLLFAHEFMYTPGLRNLCVWGMDVSEKAVRLGRENRRRVLGTLKANDGDVEFSRRGVENMRFVQMDLFDEVLDDRKWEERQRWQETPEEFETRQWDIIISNPPYISPEGFQKITARSVRRYEPKLALVPEGDIGMTDDEQADLFYKRIIELAHIHDTKLMLLEVGDLRQAIRVAKLLKRQKIWEGIEIWRDDPGKVYDPREGVKYDPTRERRHRFDIVGTGEGRSVFCWKEEARNWIGLEDDD